MFDRRHSLGHITFMALSRKKATTIALDPEDDRLLSRAARERGISRSEFIRRCLLRGPVRGRRSGPGSDDTLLSRSNSTDGIPSREARALSER